MRNSDYLHSRRSRYSLDPQHPVQASLRKVPPSGGLRCRGDPQFQFGKNLVLSRSSRAVYLRTKHRILHILAISLDNGRQLSKHQTQRKVIRLPTVFDLPHWDGFALLNNLRISGSDVIVLRDPANNSRRSVCVSRLYRAGRRHPYVAIKHSRRTKVGKADNLGTIYDVARLDILMSNTLRMHISETRS